MKRKELRQHLNEGLIDHGGQLLRHTLAVASQLNDFIPRPEYTRMLQKIQDDITEVRSGFIERVVSDQASIIDRLEELESNFRDLTTECGILRGRNMSLERVVRDQASIIDRLGNVIWPIPPLY